MQNRAKNEIFGHFINFGWFDMADIAHSDRQKWYSSADIADYDSTKCFNV